MRLARAKAGRSLPLVTALLLAALVLSAGLSWALLRPVRYQSSATLVLAPAPVDSKAVPSLLDSYQRSGTIGTFVELLSSSDVWGRAGYPPVSITVRAIPDTRAINVRASGEQQRAVQPGLAAVIRAATASQGQLGDLWQLRVLEGVSDLLLVYRIPREPSPHRHAVSRGLPRDSVD